ncbi:MAG: MerR family transcriptional regulator [Saprospiraceae bacterium]
MLIGELSSKTGLSRDTIRFYEKQGLISVARRERRFNNYKEYSEETLQRLLSVKLIKSFGFTLNEASVLLDMIEMNEATCIKVSDKIEAKVRLIDEKIKELLEIKTLLVNGMKNCQGDCSPSKSEENCPILVAPKV